MKKISRRDVLMRATTVRREQKEERKCTDEREKEKRNSKELRKLRISEEKLFENKLSCKIRVESRFLMQELMLNRRHIFL